MTVMRIDTSIDVAVLERQARMQEHWRKRRKDWVAANWKGGALLLARIWLGYGSCRFDRSTCLNPPTPPAARLKLRNQPNASAHHRNRCSCFLAFLTSSKVESCLLPSAPFLYRLSSWGRLSTPHTFVLLCCWLASACPPARRRVIHLTPRPAPPQNNQSMLYSLPISGCAFIHHARLCLSPSPCPLCLLSARAHFAAIRRPSFIISAVYFLFPALLARPCSLFAPFAHNTRTRARTPKKTHTCISLIHSHFYPCRGGAGGGGCGGRGGCGCPGANCCCCICCCICC